MIMISRKALLNWSAYSGHRLYCDFLLFLNIRPRGRMQLYEMYPQPTSRKLPQIIVLTSEALRESTNRTPM